MARFLSDFHLPKYWFDDSFASCIVDASRLGSKATGHALSSRCVLWDPPAWGLTDAFVVLYASSRDESVDVELGDVAKVGLRAVASIS